MPYLTWLLASPDKTLSDAALSTLCVLNDRHVETSFLLICHDGIPTLVDMIYHDNSVKAKKLYHTCRSNIPTSLSLLRLRDTRMYVVFAREFNHVTQISSLPHEKSLEYPTLEHRYMKNILACACLFMMLPFGDGNTKEMTTMIRNCICT